MAVKIDPQDYALPSGGEGWNGTRGLTIREYFAARALTGLLANNAMRVFYDYGDKPRSEVVARVSVDLADALIAELNKQRARGDVLRDTADDISERTS